jgi:hypothetical protein
VREVIPGPAHTREQRADSLCDIVEIIFQEHVSIICMMRTLSCGSKFIFIYSFQMS